MSQKNGLNGNGNGGEVRITCSKCQKKFPVLIGKHDGSTRMVNCRHCHWRNTFSVDLNGKVHGPVAV